MTGNFIFERIALPADPTPLSLDDDIIKASTLDAAAKMRKSEQHLRRRASNVLKKARRRAATIRDFAERAANQRVQMACTEQAQGVEELASILSNALGDMVQAVLEELLLGDAQERARLCASLAKDTLQRELGVVVRGHPDDLAILTELPLIQQYTHEPDRTVTRGTLLLRTGHGRVEVDPARLLQTLCADLKRHLTASRDLRCASSFSSESS